MNLFRRAFRPRRLAVGGAIVALAIPLNVGAATAEAPAKHCAIRVIGQHPSGEFITSEPVCRSTQAEAVAASAGPSEDGSMATMALQFTLAIHYDGANFTGASTSVTGADCLGGWLNTSADWNNRISSTRNGCSRVRHWSGYNLTGSWEDTLGLGGNLGGLNNQTSSIQYLT